MANNFFRNSVPSSVPKQHIAYGNKRIKCLLPYLLFTLTLSGGEAPRSRASLALQACGVTGSPGTAGGAGLCRKRLSRVLRNWRRQRRRPLPPASGKPGAGGARLLPAGVSLPPTVTPSPPGCHSVPRRGRQVGSS